MNIIGRTDCLEKGILMEDVFLAVRLYAHALMDLDGLSGSRSRKGINSLL